MLFKWFDAREAGKFGVTLAEFFAQRVPPQAFPSTDKKALKKSAETVVKMQDQIRRFRAEHDLNMFKKAKLANEFQWKLFSLGYDKKRVEELARELMRAL